MNVRGKFFRTKWITNCLFANSIANRAREIMSKCTKIEIKSTCKWKQIWKNKAHQVEVVYYNIKRICRSNRNHQLNENKCILELNGASNKIINWTVEEKKQEEKWKSKKAECKYEKNAAQYTNAVIVAVVRVTIRENVGKEDSWRNL